uniref:Glutathione S-transferase 7 n=1 Tax=Subpsaltria yangi TaxID=1195109 RepID=A0A2L1DG90_9HEMI|nr:glutathione S-transferase 7 [Subpsaltria yangi]
MTIDFYYTPGSSPCRAVLLTAKALGLNLNLKQVDLMKGEHLQPDFLKMNPQHTVPTIDDNGFALNESRAILSYLAEKYGKDDSLYPKDPKKRAVVNQRLYFDMGVLYQRFGDLYYPIIFGGAPFDEEKKKKLDEGYGFLDKFLENSTWVAGNNITIADIAIVASVSTAADAVGYDISSFPHVVKWFAKAKTSLPGYDEANQKGVDAFKNLYETLTKKK